MKKFAFFVALVASLASSAFGRGYFAVEGAYLPKTSLSIEDGKTLEFSGKGAFEVGIKFGGTLGVDEKHVLYGALGYQTSAKERLENQEIKGFYVPYYESKWSALKLLFGYDFRPRLSNIVRLDLGVNLGYGALNLDREYKLIKGTYYEQTTISETLGTFVYGAKAGVIIDEKFGLGVKVDKITGGNFDVTNAGVYVNFRF